MSLIKQSDPFERESVKFEGISTELLQAIEDRGIDILDCPAAPIPADLEDSEEVIVIRDCEQETGYSYDLIYTLL